MNQSNNLVLVVDDEEIIREVTKELLENLNCTVILASNGDDAIDIYKKYSSEIKLVILDLVMPGIDGATTFSELKKINAEVKLLICSSYVSATTLSSLMQNGVQGVLHKPFTYLDLATSLNNLID